MKNLRPSAMAALALSGLLLTGSLFGQASVKNRNEKLQTIENPASFLLNRTTGCNNADISKEVRELRTELNNLRLKNNVSPTVRYVNSTENAVGFLGIVPGSRTASGGITINEIIGNSGAEKAGLLAGDVILSLDGKKVDTHTDITSVISAKKPNETIAVTLLRNGEEKVIFATLGARQKTSYTVLVQNANTPTESKTININLNGNSKNWENSIAALNQFNSIKWVSEKETGNPCEKLREMRSASLLGVYVNYNAKSGVGIQDVISNTGAQSSGLQSGDIITSVSGIDVNSYIELRRVVTMHKPGETVVVTFLRDGQVQRVNTTLSSLADTKQEVVASLEAECSKVETPAPDKSAPGTAIPGIQSDETPSSSMLTVSPNPTNGITNLHLTGDSKEIAVVTVMDLKGSLVLTQELSSGAKDATLDLTSFPKGMYIITVNQGEHKFSEKIVVN